MNTVAGIAEVRPGQRIVPMRFASTRLPVAVLSKIPTPIRPLPATVLFRTILFGARTIPMPSMPFATDAGEASVQSDDVAFDRIEGRTYFEDADTVRRVPGEHVAGSCLRTADDGAGRVRYGDTVELVRDGGVPCGVGADVIALDQVPDRSGAGDGDAVDGVSGDHVTLRRGEATDTIRARSVDENASTSVWTRQSARGIRAQVVGFDDVSAASAYGNAIAGEAIDRQSTNRRVATSHRSARSCQCLYVTVPFNSMSGAPE